MSDVETRHVVGVSENDNTMTITLEKAPPPPMLQPDAGNEGPHYPPKNAYEDDGRAGGNEIIRREVELNARKIDEENRTVELAFSSEFPVERGYGIEVLDHTPASVKLERLNNSAPLFVIHNSDDQV